MKHFTISELCNSDNGESQGHLQYAYTRNRTQPDGVG